MTTDSARRDGEKTTNITAPNNSGKVPIVEKERGLPAESLPGWTIMRPLRKKGTKTSGSASGPNGVSNANGTELSMDGKNGNGLKTMDSTTSSDGYGVGEIEALREIRSDDELLEDDGRGTRPQGHHSDHHNLQSNGDIPERTVSGGVQYKVYKRRWFGLVQLVLLNIIVSWDVSAPEAPYIQIVTY